MSFDSLNGCPFFYDEPPKIADERIVVQENIDLSLSNVREASYSVHDLRFQEHFRNSVSQ
jgi:hypothetical protein